jgi:hypothetical protein
LKRHHWGRGLFCLSFLARVALVRKVFCEGILRSDWRERGVRRGGEVESKMKGGHSQ